MTREQAKKLLPIIQAFSEGKTVQFKVKQSNYATWTDCSDNQPSLNDATVDYRIKTKTLLVLVRSSS